MVTTRKSSNSYSVSVVKAAKKAATIAVKRRRAPLRNIQNNTPSNENKSGGSYLKKGANIKRSLNRETRDTKDSNTRSNTELQEEKESEEPPCEDDNTRGTLVDKKKDIAKKKIMDKRVRQTTARQTKKRKNYIGEKCDDSSKDSEDEEVISSSKRKSNLGTRATPSQSNQAEKAHGTTKITRSRGKKAKKRPTQAVSIEKISNDKYHKNHTNAEDSADVDCDNENAKQVNSTRKKSSRSSSRRQALVGKSKNEERRQTRKVQSKDLATITSETEGMSESEDDAFEDQDDGDIYEDDSNEKVLPSSTTTRSMSPQTKGHQWRREVSPSLDFIESGGDWRVQGAIDYDFC